MCLDDAHELSMLDQCKELARLGAALRRDMTQPEPPCTLCAEQGRLCWIHRVQIGRKENP